MSYGVCFVGWLRVVLVCVFVVCVYVYPCVRYVCGVCVRGPTQKVETQSLSILFCLRLRSFTRCVDTETCGSVDGDPITVDRPWSSNLFGPEDGERSPFQLDLLERLSKVVRVLPRETTPFCYPVRITVVRRHTDTLSELERLRDNRSILLLHTIPLSSPEPYSLPTLRTETVEIPEPSQGNGTTRNQRG